MNRYYLKMWTRNNYWMLSSIGPRDGYDDINQAYRRCATTTISVPNFQFTISLSPFNESLPIPSPKP